MRNDVKLGFAIGGVLLAVVIVFALVNSGTPADPPTDPTAQAETAGTTAVVTPSQAAGTTPTAAGSGTRTGTALSTPAETTTTDVFANTNSSTPVPAQPTNWNDVLSTGKLPTMMNTQTTPGAGVASTTTRPAGGVSINSNNTTNALPRAPITVPSVTTESPTAGSNVPAVLGGGVNDRSGNARVDLPSPRTTQPDSDRIVREASRNAGETRATGTTLSTPAKTVLTARTHAIKSGETFSTIAASQYGHIRFARLIAKANPGVDSSRLKIGQVINLPAYDGPAEASATAKANTPATVDGNRQYRVQAGDSLHSIAVKLYSDPRKVDAIYDANKSAIGADRAKLKVGTVLTLPTPPAVARK